MMGDTGTGQSRGGHDPAWGSVRASWEEVTAPLRPEYDCAGCGWLERAQMERCAGRRGHRAQMSLCEPEGDE